MRSFYYVCWILFGVPTILHLDIILCLLWFGFWTSPYCHFDTILISCNIICSTANNWCTQVCIVASNDLLSVVPLHIQHFSHCSKYKNNTVWSTWKTVFPYSHAGFTQFGACRDKRLTPLAALCRETDDQVTPPPWSMTQQVIWELQSSLPVLTLLA